MSTSTRAVANDRARAYRWLAATRSLTALTSTAGLDGRRQQGAAQARLRVLAAAMRSDRPCVNGHGDRVGSLSRRLALAIGLTPDEAELVAMAGVLHDIGALGGAPIADEAEVVVQRRHALIGALLVAPFDLLALATPMIRHHHEQLDGSGYPDGLRGDTIPIGARIIAVADAYDRLTTAANARATPHDIALVHLAGQAQRKLDATVLGALIDLPLP